MISKISRSLICVLAFRAAFSYDMVVRVHMYEYEYYILRVRELEVQITKSKLVYDMLATFRDRWVLRKAIEVTPGLTRDT